MTCKKVDVSMLLILKFDLMLSMQLTRLYQNLLPQEGVSAALP